MPHQTWTSFESGGVTANASERGSLPGSWAAMAERGVNGGGDPPSVEVLVGAACARAGEGASLLGHPGAAVIPEHEGDENERADANRHEGKHREHERRHRRVLGDDLR